MALLRLLSTLTMVPTSSDSSSFRALIMAAPLCADLLPPAPCRFSVATRPAAFASVSSRAVFGADVWTPLLAPTFTGDQSCPLLGLCCCGMVNCFVLFSLSLEGGSLVVSVVDVCGGASFWPLGRMHCSVTRLDMDSTWIAVTLYFKYSVRLRTPQG